MKFGIWVIRVNGWENERWFLAPEFHPEKKEAEALCKLLQETETKKCYAYEVREHDKEEQ